MRIGRRISMVELNQNINGNLTLGGLLGNFSYVQTTNAVILSLRSGMAAGAGAGMSFGDNGIGLGRWTLNVPDAALTGNVATMRVTGNTDTPFLDMISHRIASIADPTTAQDALTHHAWAAFTPTAAWTGGDPAAVTITGSYVVIGKTLFFTLLVSSADSNACTALTLTNFPVATNSGINVHVHCMETYGAAGTTYKDPFAYMSPGTSTMYFKDFAAATDGQAVALQMQGFYPVA